MSDLGQLNATLAEALAVIRAAETALEEAYAAAARDFGIVEAVAGSDPGPTLGRSLTQLQEAMTSIRAERARLAGARADIQADLARIGQRKVSVSPGVTSTATSGVAASTRAEGLADADARAAWVRERLTSPDPNIRKPARSGVRWADYQRAVAGPDEIFVTSDSPRARGMGRWHWHRAGHGRRYRGQVHQQARSQHVRRQGAPRDAGESPERLRSRDSSLRPRSPVPEQSGRPPAACGQYRSRWRIPGSASATTAW